MRIRRSFTALAAVLIASTGCRIPRFEGPQIQQPPPGFTLRGDPDSRSTMFPDREATFGSTWVHNDMSGVSLISVLGYPTVFDLDEVVAAQERVRAATTDTDAVFGDIEAIRIDGRDAWGWSERVESPRRGLVSTSYRAVVPYDTVSYAIEFSSGEPSLKRAAPDTLRAVISSFGIGQTTYNVPLIVIVLGALLLGVSMLRARSKERADRLRAINLVRIDRQEEPSGPEPTSDQPGETARGGHPGIRMPRRHPP